MPAPPRPAQPGVRLLVALVAVAAGLGCGDGTAPAPVPEPAALAVVRAPQRAVVGRTLDRVPVVELRSATGEPVEVAGVPVTASVSSGTLGGTTSVLTDDAGRAAFPSLVLEGEPGPVELRFACCGLPAAVHGLSLVLTDITIYPVSHPTFTRPVSSTLTPGPAVRVLDGNRQPIAGREVRFALEGGRLPDAIIRTAGDGTARLGELRMSDLIGVEVLTATDIESGASLQFELFTTPLVRVDPIDEGFEPVVAVGAVVALPRMHVTNGLPIANAEVRYRIAYGGGSLSAEASFTDENGDSGPVTLTTSERGRTIVEITVAEIFEEPFTVAVHAVVGPVTFAFPDGCEAGCPPFTFDWTDFDGPILVKVLVQDAEGFLPGYPVTLTEGGEAGEFVESGDFVYDWGPFPFVIPSGSPWATEGDGVTRFVWYPPQGSGTYAMTVSAPMVAAPWTFTVTVQ